VGRERAVEVVEVVRGTPAERAGLRPEDLIVSVDGAPVLGVEDLQRLMVAERIGVPTALEVVREGRLRELELVPAELES
jgi:S1-C subfamily serine protease